MILLLQLSHNKMMKKLTLVPEFWKIQKCPKGITSKQLLLFARQHRIHVLNNFLIIKEQILAPKPFFGANLGIPFQQYNKKKLLVTY